MRALFTYAQQVQIACAIGEAIEALTAGLQKISAQLAAASPSRGGLEASKFATGRIRRGGHDRQGFVLFLRKAQPPCGQTYF